MNCTQVRIQMEAYRTGGEDTLSPAFREMKEHLESCPMCRERLERIQNIDRDIGRVMRDVRVPEGLEDAILGGIRPEQNPAARWRSRLLRPAGLSLALGVAAVFVALLMGRSVLAPSPEIRLLRVFIDDSRTNSHLDARFTGTEAVKAWFAEEGFEVEIPERLNRDFPMIGCRKVLIQGHPVAFLCLEEGSRILALYVFDRGSIDSRAFDENGTWELSRAGFVARGWSEGDKTFVVTLPGDPSGLDEFLSVG